MLRPLSLILVAGLLAACGGRTAAPATAPSPAARPAGDPASLHYGAGSARYRYEQTQHATQEVMGQTQQSDATTSMVLSATFAAEAGNLAAAFTVDSIAVTSPMVAASGLDALRGKTFRSTFTLQGRPVSFAPPDTTALAALGGEMFRDFLPSLPAGPLVAGTTWIDTVTAPPTSAQGMTVSTRSVRTHRVVGWETRDGARALHIATTGNYTITGEGQQGGQALQLEGAGVATSDRFVSAVGVFLGAESNDSTNVSVTVVAMGLLVPVRQLRHTTLTRLP